MKWPFPRPELSRDARAFGLARQIVTARDELGRLPEAGWFGRNKTSAERHIEALWQEMIALLEAGPLLDAREALRTAETTLAKARAAEATVRERVGPRAAPTAPEVARAAEETLRAEVALTTARTRLASAFQEAHVQLTEDQLDALAVLPGGDDDIGMIAFVVNLREVMNALEGLLRDTSDRAAAGRYYGYYALFLETMLVVQERIATRIRDEHVPNIKARFAAMKALQKQTAKLRSAETDPVRRRVLEANEVAQKTALAAVEIAEQRFQQKLKRLSQVVARTRADLVVAQNTLETVRATQELVEVLRHTDQLFDDLTQLSMPEVIPFAGDEIRAELMRLSGRLLVNESDPERVRPDTAKVGTVGAAIGATIRRKSKS